MAPRACAAHLTAIVHTRRAQYSTEVCLGSPGRRFDLIIDTGSSITAVPCSSCKSCGKHHCGRYGRCFDPKYSPSSRTVNCRSPPSGYSCERCAAADKCQYSVHYTEGSSIQGHVVTDVAHFSRSMPSGASMRVSSRVYFGCQTHESGMFFRQDADGIMGLQPPRARARVPSVLTSLVQGEHASNAFSLCLADTKGLFLLGGKPDLVKMRAHGALTLGTVGGAKARYTLALREIKVSGAGAQNGTFKSLNLPPSTYAPTLVDSGTTFVYASTPLYRALHTHLHSQTPSLQREGGKVCAYLSEAQKQSMPSLQFVFSNGARPLLVRPHQYMVEFPKSATPPGKRHYCAAIFDNQRSGAPPEELTNGLPPRSRAPSRPRGHMSIASPPTLPIPHAHPPPCPSSPMPILPHASGTVIGASIMRHREVIFDISTGSISFADADCERITPATSLLTSAYAFAACPTPTAGNQSADGTSLSPPAHPIPRSSSATWTRARHALARKLPFGGRLSASDMRATKPGARTKRGNAKGSLTRASLKLRSGSAAKWHGGGIKPGGAGKRAGAWQEHAMGGEGLDVAVQKSNRRVRSRTTSRRTSVSAIAGDNSPEAAELS